MGAQDVRSIPIEAVNGVGVYEALDFKRLRRFQFDGLDLFIGKQDVVVSFRLRSASRDWNAVRDLYRVSNDHPDPVAGRRIYQVERYVTCDCGCGVEPHGAANERKPKAPLPSRSGGKARERDRASTRCRFFKTRRCHDYYPLG